MIKHSIRRGVSCIGILVDSALFTALIILSVRFAIGVSGHVAASLLIGFGLFVFVLSMRLLRERNRAKKAEIMYKRNDRIEQLLLMDDETISALLHKDRFVLIRKRNPAPFDVLDALRTGADTIGLAKTDEHMLALICKYKPKTTVMTFDDLITELFGENESFLRQKHSVKTLSHLKYWMLGFILLFVSIFVRHKIYYRMVSSLCMIIALVSGFFVKHPERNILRIFLDKMGH